MAQASDYGDVLGRLEALREELWPVANWAKVRRELTRLRRRGGAARDRSAESARFDWYGDGCPCGLASGECREHPRARPSQRPPAGDWRTWLLLMGRGSGKTRSAAEWVRHRVETGPVASDRPGGGHGGRRAGRDGRGPQRPPRRLPALGPAAVRALQAPADLAQRRGGDDFTADEPDRLRGPQHDGAWLDELAAFRYPAALDNLLLRPPPGRGSAALRHHDAKARPPGDRPGGGPDDGARPGDDLREPGAPGVVVLRADRDASTRGRGWAAGAAGGDPGGVRRGVVLVVRRVAHVTPRRPSTSRATRCTWRSTAGSPGTWRRSGSRCGRCGGICRRVLPDRPRRRAPRRAGRVLRRRSRWCRGSRTRSTVTVFGDFHCEGLYSRGGGAGDPGARRGRCPAAAGGSGPGAARPGLDGRTGIGPTAYGEFDRVFGLDPGPMAVAPGDRRPRSARGVVGPGLPARCTRGVRP